MATTPKNREHTTVDYLIIGAGLSGLTLKNFLNNERTVLLDANPGAYKIGESFIPETFHHPEMRKLVPNIQLLPSYSPKIGTTFISPTSAASFPLPQECQEFSMHVARSELENLLQKAWRLDIQTERVSKVDLNNKRVYTNHTCYQVEKQIIDCSGPAMTVARSIDDVINVRPIFGTWTYFDITENHPDQFWQFIRKTNRQYKRYNLTKRCVLSDREEDGWQPAHSTALTKLQDGLWSWQIPLFNQKLLSFGLVSREAKISAEQLLESAHRTHLPHYSIAKRPENRKSPYNRVHTRHGFAKRATTPATEDYILVADACSFSDPVYSIGGGLAVNKAIELAGLLNSGGWSTTKCEMWCANFEQLFERSLNAFDLWYTGNLLENDVAAREVQSHLIGTPFQLAIAEQYSRVVNDSTLSEYSDSEQNYGDWQPKPKEVSSKLADLLGIASDPILADWILEGAVATPAGIEHRWKHEGLPDLIIDTEFSSENPQYYRRIGNITFSFKNLEDGPYPLDDRARALFDALEEAARKHPRDWKALAPPNKTTREP